MWDGNPATRNIYSFNHRRNLPIAQLESRKPVPGRVQRVPASLLPQWQPNPGQHGNPPNARGDAHWTRTNFLVALSHFTTERWTAGATNFGPVAVLNDVLLQPARAMARKEHRDVHVLWTVVEGELTLWDSIGQVERVVACGQWVHVRGGTGVTVALRNASNEHPLRLVELHVSVLEYSAQPAVEVTSPLAPAQGWTDVPVTLEPGVDAVLRVGRLADAASGLQLHLEAGRRAYGVLLQGSGVTAGAEQLEANDGVRFHGDVLLTGSGGEVFLLLVECKDL